MSRSNLRQFSLLAIVGVLAISLIGWYLLAHPEVLPPEDFVEYWAAARVALDGGDPYDGDQLLPRQKAAANKPDMTEAVMMWNPPWTLPIYLPLAMLEPRPAQLLWLAFQAAIIVGSSILLWNLFGGPRAHVGAVPLVALTFFATLWTFRYGQNTGLLLLGLAGFAHCEAKQRPVLAGCFAALTALKPHLLAVFGVLLVLNAFRPRGLTTLLAGIATLAIGLAIAMLVDPEILTQYRRATLRSDAEGTTKPLSGWVVPLASYYIRVAIDPQRFWIQFVPCAIACIGYGWYFWRRRETWNWTSELPPIVWVSVLTAPYGGWIFDLVVLLVPVVQASVWLANEGRPGMIRIFAGCHLLLGAATLVLTGRVFRYLEDFWWAAPVTGLLCMTAWYCTRGGGGARFAPVKSGAQP